MVRIVLIVIAVLALMYGVGRFRALERPAKHRYGRWTLYLLLAAVSVVLLSRVGLHWLGVVGAAAWSAARLLVPLLLRLLPLISARGRGANGPDHAAGSRDYDAGAPDLRSGMSAAEAREVLNVPPGATREQIIASYRTLIRKVHPDVPGGSTYLAAKLNQAKDVLLGSG